MYICSCHAVTDGQIKAFAKEHGCNWRKLMRDTGVGTQCGTCAKSAKELLESLAPPLKPRVPRKRKPAAVAVPDCCACSCGKGGCASLKLAELTKPSDSSA